MNTTRQPRTLVFVDRGGSDREGDLHETDRFPRRKSKIVFQIGFPEIASINIYIFSEWDCMDLFPNFTVSQV